MLNLAWIFVWDRSSVDGQNGLTILAFFILISIALSNIAVRMMIENHENDVLYGVTILAFFISLCHFLPTLDLHFGELGAHLMMI